MKISLKTANAFPLQWIKGGGGSKLVACSRGFTGEELESNQLKIIDIECRGGQRMSEVIQRELRDDFVLADERLMHTLFEDQDLIPGDWYDIHAPVVFLGSVAVNEQRGWRNYPGLWNMLNTPGHWWPFMYPDYVQPPFKECFRVPVIRLS